MDYLAIPEMFMRVWFIPLYFMVPLTLVKYFIFRNN